MLSELKDYLRISDDEENVYLETLISQGKTYLNNLAGVELDFNLSASAKTLLKDYCRYAYNNATEYFLENFQNDIQRLQLESAVIDNVKQKTSNE